MALRLRFPLYILISLPLLVCSAQGRSFNGFYNPEFVRDETPPYVPVSTTASLSLGPEVAGQLIFRELGTYRLWGTLTDGQLNLELEKEDRSQSGRAKGRLEHNRLELELVLMSGEETLYSHGRLFLEADVEWKGSRVLKPGKRLVDGVGRLWYEPLFDDAAWTAVELPDNNSFGEEEPRNRFYRSHFWMGKPREAISVTLSRDTREPTAGETSQESEAINLVFASDDGIWIYVNGRILGHWGAPEKRGGCVNDPLKRCGVDGSVPPVSVPEDYLQPGDNVIAVKVHNGECCFTYFNLLVARVRTRLVSDPLP
jgi:hypothetical protein